MAPALFQRWRLAIALVLALALICAPPFHVVSHNPALLATSEFERHSALAAADFADRDDDDDHGHSHDDGDSPEHRHGHAHGHDPSDHNHDSGQPGLAGPGFGIHPRAEHQRWPSVQQDDGLRDRLERPPRALS